VKRNLVADESNAVLILLELLLVAGLGLRSDKVMAVVAISRLVKDNGSAELDVGDVTDLDIGIDGDEGRLGVADGEAVVDVLGVALLGTVAVSLAETLAADRLVVGDEAGVVRAGGRLAVAVVVAVTVVAIVATGDDATGNDAAGDNTTVVAAGDDAAGDDTTVVLVGAVGKEVNVDVGLILITLTTNVKIQKTALATEHAGVGESININGSLLTSGILLATDVHIEKLLAAVVVGVVGVVGAAADEATTTTTKQTIGAHKAVEVKKATEDSVALLVTNNQDVLLTEKVEGNEAILVIDSEIKDVVLLVANSDRQQRVQLNVLGPLTVDQVKSLIIGNGTSGSEVLLEFLLGQETQEDQELIVQGDGVLAADLLVDLVAGLLVAALLCYVLLLKS
jgi:hypothetical protein